MPNILSSSQVAIYVRPLSAELLPFVADVQQDIGCAVGSLIVFFWGEDIGRKRMIMAGAITMLIGTVRTYLYFLVGKLDADA